MIEQIRSQRRFTYVMDYRVFGLWRAPECDWASADVIDAHISVLNRLCAEGENHSNEDFSSCEEEFEYIDEYELSEADKAAVEELIGETDRQIEGVGFTCRIYIPVRIPSEDLAGMSDDEVIDFVALKCGSDEGIEMLETSFWVHEDEFEEVESALVSWRVEPE